MLSRDAANKLEGVKVKLFEAEVRNIFEKVI
jgi:hypothetical protein